MKTLLLLTSIFCLSSCAVIPLLIGVNLINQSYKNVGVNTFGEIGGHITSYAILPAGDGQGSNALKFAEFADYAHRILEMNGFKRTDEASADMLISLGYGTSDPIEEITTSDDPVYGWNNIPVTTTDAEGNVATSTQSVWGITHYETSSSGQLWYLHHVELLAYSQNGGGTGQLLWSAETDFRTTRTDLRATVPYMVYALKGWIGKDTKKRILVSVGTNEQGYKSFVGDGG